MKAALRAELFKQRSTRTVLGLFAAMVGLVLFVTLLHGLGLSAENFDGTAEQITAVFGWGEVLGALFAALLGAISMTGEIRHGTIRPTFLVNPHRRSVVAAKVWASMLIATGFGLVAGALAAGAGTATLRARGIDVRLDAGDYALLVIGGAAAAALWAAIGVGVGALVRNQVPALVGITVWLLFVENLLVGDIAGIDAVGRLLPAAAGRAISGQAPETLLAPAVALVLLILYAAAAAVAGSLAASRRDVA
ncbi:MAG: ABC transporter permease [Gaiellaceae bacterium MAG52_C11]|nr:ABC transporter permease [Candidatus Gaiellasilicea maunaloa]